MKNIKWITIFSLLVFFIMPEAIMSKEVKKIEKVSKVQSAYLNSIHEDISFIIEGIELFIMRDYPHFWRSIETKTPVDPIIVKKYVNETSNFRKILDTHLKEFITYKNASGEKSFGKIEKEILQMLSYAYLNTGSFITSKALKDSENIMDHKTMIEISELDGKRKIIDLSDKLKKRSELVEKSLGTINLKLKYFSNEDINEIDAYIEISESDITDTINIMYASSYKGVVPYSLDQKHYKISMNMLFSFLNNLKYYDTSAFTKSSQKDDLFENRTYNIPMIKGVYSISGDNNSLSLAKKNISSFELVKKCRFRGLESTGFGIDKKGEKDIITLLKDKKAFKKGDFVRYGNYTLSVNNKTAGFIKLIPCHMNACVNYKIKNKALTPVKVFNHDLVFFEDVIDQVKMNKKQYNKVYYTEIKDDDMEDKHTLGLKNDDVNKDSYTDKIPKKDDKYEKRGLGKSEEKVHLFRGCSPKSKSLF